jgi:dihydroxyacid dehydratase/phosphogluconate dehydratase
LRLLELVFASSKITGVKSKRISGPARVFESAEARPEAILAGQIKPNLAESYAEA